MTDEDNAALVVKEGMKQLFAPYHDLISKLLGPAASEVGLGWGDSMKVWRLKRQIRLLQEVKRLVDQIGQDITPLATRLFFPVFEAASIEDDDEMQTRWAALLANEATNVGSVHPSFIEILKQLAPDDARLLDKIFDWCDSKRTRTIEWWLVSPVGEQRQHDDEALENLVRLGLVVSNYELIAEKTTYILPDRKTQSIGSKQQLKEDYKLSDLAVRFVKACRAPEPSES